MVKQLDGYSGFSMKYLVSIGIAAFCFFILILFILLILTWLGPKKHLPLPPESGQGWSNNAIRRQGKSGKGIR